jgi:hypothetical protein
MRQLSPKYVSVAALLGTAAAATVASFLLWREAPLYAAMLCGFILFSAARSLPAKRGLAYSMFLGFGIGIFVGGAAGAARLLF